MCELQERTRKELFSLKRNRVCRLKLERQPHLNQSFSQSIFIHRLIRVANENYLVGGNNIEGL